MFARKVTKIMDMALKTGVPVIGLNDSGGARIQEGVVSLGGYAEIFFRNVLASGVIPQISAIMGPCAGGAVYSPAMTDFTFMVDKTSYMFITGPDVIKAVLNQTVSFEELGGAKVHNTTSGVAHFFARDEKECLQQMRKLLSYIPSNNREDPPEAPARMPTGRKEELNAILPDDYNKPYDMKDIIIRIVDGGELLEVQPLWAANMITAFARINGRTIGIVANQPKFNAGVIDINLAWPSAEIAVMGPEGATNIIFRDELTNARNPEAKAKELVNSYREKFANPYIAAERGYIDDVIEPSKTREILVNYLEVLKTKREARPPRKHGNIPL